MTCPNKKKRILQSKIRFPAPLFRMLELLGEALDDFGAVRVCVSLYSIFVEGEQTTVEHHVAAIDHYGVHVGGFGGVNQMGINVIEGCLMRAVKADCDYDGTLANLDRADHVFHMKCTRSANGSHREYLFGRERFRIAGAELVKLGGRVHFLPHAEIVVRRGAVRTQSDPHVSSKHRG